MNYFAFPGIHVIKVLTRFEIFDAMCDELNITREVIRDKNREYDFVYRRMILCHMVKLYAYGKNTDQEIADMIHTNRTAPIHYRKTFEGAFKYDAKFRKMFDQVKTRIFRDSYRKKFGFDPLRSNEPTRDANDLPEVQTEQENADQPSPTGETRFRFDVVPK